MRFLLDTNIIIPLEDSALPLEESLARFVRLAHEHGHHLVYHPASVDDINRDPDLQRRARTLERLRQYTPLGARLTCPWNTPATSANDASDNEILYALHCDAVHALVTEDRAIHDKARQRGLVQRVYTIQTADDFLRRLHEATYVRLPNIEDVPLHALTRFLGDSFFDSLREGYQPFDEWFREKAREGRTAWVYWDAPDQLGALCIYVRQDNETITDDGLVLRGPALKLSTFKVGASCRGRKIGELFLKAAFRHASANGLEHIFIHGNAEKQHFLFQLLEDFGFFNVGKYRGDVVYVKDHPAAPPAETKNIGAFDYLRRYYPHFRQDTSTQKFLIPIQPGFHNVLFPDYSSKQLQLFLPTNPAGNAIKLAYLSHAPTKDIHPGDIVLFYRSGDHQAITSIGVVEEYQTLTDAQAIAGLVSRRTVYSMSDIELMAAKPTRVMLFRLVRHLSNPVTFEWLRARGIVRGNVQTIRKIEQAAYDAIIQEGR